MTDIENAKLKEKIALFTKQLEDMSDDDGGSEILQATLYDPVWLNRFLMNSAWDCESAGLFAADLVKEITFHCKEYDT